VIERTQEKTKTHPEKGVPGHEPIETNPQKAVFRKGAQRSERENGGSGDGEGVGISKISK